MRSPGVHSLTSACALLQRPRWRGRPSVAMASSARDWPTERPTGFTGQRPSSERCGDAEGPRGDLRCRLGLLAGHGSAAAEPTQRRNGVRTGIPGTLPRHLCPSEARRERRRRRGRRRPRGGGERGRTTRSDFKINSSPAASTRGRRATRSWNSALPYHGKGTLCDIPRDLLPFITPRKVALSFGGSRKRNHGLPSTSASKRDRKNCTHRSLLFLL